METKVSLSREVAQATMDAIGRSNGSPTQVEDLIEMATKTYLERVLGAIRDRLVADHTKESIIKYIDKIKQEV